MSRGWRGGAAAESQQGNLTKLRFGLIEPWNDAELQENSARLNGFKSVCLVVSASLAGHHYNYLALASHYSELWAGEQRTRLSRRADELY